MTPHADRPLGWAASLALVAGVVAAGAVAVHLAPDGRAVATFWPAAGLGLILLSLTPMRRWLLLGPLLVVAVAAGDVIAERGLRLAVAHGMVEAIALVIAALLVTHAGRTRPRLIDQEDFVRLFGAALVSGGLIVLGGLSASRLVTLEPLGVSLATTFAAHVAAVLLLFPLAVVTENHWTGGKLELLAQIGLLSAASVLTFVPGASSTLSFAPVLFLAWAALRFDLRVACAELVLVGIFVTAQTVGGIGPFGDAVDTDRVSSLTGGDADAGLPGLRRAAGAAARHRRAAQHDPDGPDHRRRQAVPPQLHRVAGRHGVPRAR